MSALEEEVVVVVGEVSDDASALGGYPAFQGSRRLSTCSLNMRTWSYRSDISHLCQ